MNLINLIGFASGISANNRDTGFGPQYLLEHRELFNQVGLEPNWQFMEYLASPHHGLEVMDDLGKIFYKLSMDILEIIQQPQPFAVIGGDHSMAMATWHTIIDYYRPAGPVGLLWIDAHMDSNTPISSVTKNVHGMPLSHLLGVWHDRHIDSELPKNILRPEHLALIGVRSYEIPEYQYLKDLGVRVYFIDEVLTRGLDVVLAEAFDNIYQLTDQIGISIDLDAFDPSDCPGVGYHEKDGLNLEAFLSFFKNFYYKNWVAVEIVEFNPVVDQENKTALSIAKLIDAMYF
jgi:arginase